MGRVRIGVCQIFGLDGDRSGNFRRIENAVCEAVKANAEIACFPETIVLGWVNSDAHKRAHAIPGADTERLGEIASRYKIWICAGVSEKADGRLYDSAVLIDDAGKIRLKHRKINILKHLMRPPYTPGEGVGVAETPFGQIGVLICADTFDDGVLGRMKALRPDLLLVPYGWAAPEEKWPEHGEELRKVVQNAAKRVGCAVVGTDLVGEITKGPWFGQVYGGQSVVCGRDGQVLRRLADRDREVAVVSVELP